MLHANRAGAQNSLAVMNDPLVQDVWTAVKGTDVSIGIALSKGKGSSAKFQRKETGRYHDRILLIRVSAILHR